MGKRVLIVDDAAFMRMMIKDILTKNGYDVVGEAENGQVAVEKYRDLKPDLVPWISPCRKWTVLRQSKKSNPRILQPES